MSIVVRNAHSSVPMSADDLLASFGKEWRGDVENESAALRIAGSALDDGGISEPSGSQAPQNIDPPSSINQMDTATAPETSPIAAVVPPTAPPQAKVDSPAQTPTATSQLPEIVSPVSCECSEHKGRMFLDTIIPAPINVVYSKQPIN